MKHVVLFLSFLLILFASSGAQSSHNNDGESRGVTVLFRSGENGYGNYRIPSIITTTKGTVLAFCEGRKKPGDAGDIDLLYKRSTDNGKTWSEQKVIWDDGNNTCGNPCAVVDKETGIIWLLITHNIGSDAETKIIHKTGQGTRTVWVCKSEDDGLTWSAPVDITATTKKPLWGWYATGPGIGIQIRFGPRKGRLVIPCDHSYDIVDKSSGKLTYGYGANIIYSDDHGKSWELGGSITPEVNESQVAEVADGNGTLLMNMRSDFGRHCRAQSISYDGGLSWSAPADIPDLAEPVCQGSIFRYSWPGKKRKSCLLFLNPASTSVRHNLSIRISYDEGKTWPFIKTLYAGPAAYSCMTLLKDGNIGCLYEAGIERPYETILFEKLELKRLLK